MERFCFDWLFSLEYFLILLCFCSCNPLSLGEGGISYKVKIKKDHVKFLELKQNIIRMLLFHVSLWDPLWRGSERVPPVCVQQSRVRCNKHWMLFCWWHACQQNREEFSHSELLLTGKRRTQHSHYNLKWLK